MSEDTTRRKTLVMFSGGKDSFLTAARCASEGDFVGLFTCHNGCMRYEQHLAHGATRLVNRFGADNIKYEGIYSTAGIVWLLQRWYIEQPLRALSWELADVPPVHLTCLHCQTAMWIASIAFAKAHGYNRICTGYLETDEFCTGTTQWTQAMQALAKANGVESDFPVWHNTDPQYSWNIARDRELARFCFVPQMLEPQCMLGQPAPIPASQVGEQLSNYYDEHLLPLCQPEIDSLVKTFTYQILQVPTTEGLKYAVPDPATGEF